MIHKHVSMLFRSLFWSSHRFTCNLMKGWLDSSMCRNSMGTCRNNSWWPWQTCFRNRSCLQAPECNFHRLRSYRKTSEVVDCRTATLVLLLKVFLGSGILCSPPGKTNDIYITSPVSNTELSLSWRRIYPRRTEGCDGNDPGGLSDCLYCFCYIISLVHWPFQTSGEASFWCITKVSLTQGSAASKSIFILLVHSGTK